ncbi:MAG TPA: hypothetical protein PKG48_03755 [Bacteroidales bacterium]|nr:hypothetical protein [Bacteroidales bacterium]
MRTNKRRNLNQGQWAVIGIEAEEIAQSIRAAVEAERRKKQSETQSTKTIQPTDTLFVDQKGKEIKPVAVVQKIVPSELGAITQNFVEQPIKRSERETSAILAKMFNTNRTYINDARKFQETAFVFI